MATKTITLTQGAINSGYFYLRSSRDFFPPDTIGGSSMVDAAPKTITITWGDSEQIETDIAGDKMIFRKRGWFSEFVSHFRLKAGDRIVLQRHSHYSYSVRPMA